MKNLNKNMKAKSISQLLKEINQELSVPTQAEIAKELDFTESYLSMILKGDRTPKNLREILTNILIVIKSKKNMNPLTGKQKSKKCFEVDGILFEGDIKQAIKKYLKQKPELGWMKWLTENYRYLS